MNVGFVGTGTMGAPMLGNLVKKGFGVVAYDVAPAALANAEKRGATRAESAADAARRSDLVITMLPSSSHIETAYLGKNGIAEGLTAGRLCVDMSTVDPAASRRVAQSLAAKSASSNDYTPGFMTDLMAKDLGLAVNAARELRVPVVVAPAAQQVLRLASSHGLGRRDFTSVYLFLKPSGEQAPV